MKRALSILIVLTLMTCFAMRAEADNVFSSKVNKQVETAIAGNRLTAPDEYGTPLAIKLARQGNIQKLQQLAQLSPDGTFVNVHDKYNNNLFHVAKDANTVQALAGLIRQFYPAQTQGIISRLVNERNATGETPLLAQINAGHGDTFHLLYAPSILKQKNEEARNHLARLQGSVPEIVERNKAIYCKEIRSLASANGLTLLQAAQGQIPYHPQMAPLAQEIAQLIPCIAQN